jgi:hypothetical protein
MSNHAPWFAIRVKSNRENVTCQALIGKGYPVMLPLFRATAESRRAPTPLFPGYLFSSFDVNYRLPILIIPGVVHIVGMGKTPIPIDQDEIDSLRIVLETGLPLQREEDYSLGQKVRITRGPLAGAAGTIIGRHNERFAVSITLLQRSVSVLLQSDWIRAELSETAIKPGGIAMKQGGGM